MSMLSMRRIAVLSWIGSAGVIALAALAQPQGIGMWQGQTVWAAMSALLAIFVWRGGWLAARTLIGPLTGGLLSTLLDLVQAGARWPAPLPAGTDSLAYELVAIATALCLAVALAALLRHDFGPQLAGAEAAADRSRSAWVAGLVDSVRAVLDDATSGALPISAAATRVGGLANGMHGDVPAVVRAAIYRARDDLTTILPSAEPARNAALAEAAARFEATVTGASLQDGSSAAISVPKAQTGRVILAILLILAAMAAISWAAGGWIVWIN